MRVASWTFLTYHARVLLCVAHDPGVRLRDIAASLNITERSAFGIITDLVEAGYLVKEKNGRRNRLSGARIRAEHLSWASILGARALPPRIPHRVPRVRVACAARPQRCLERPGDLGVAA